MHEVEFSILVCTSNRCAQLDRLLTSIKNLRIPEDCTWELVIVDNASRDDTQKIIRAYQNVLPIKSLIELRQGVSHARNTSRREASGQWLFSTDDDVTLPPGWFEAYVRASRRYPDAAFFGGDIVPYFPGADCKWINAAVRAASSSFAQFKVGRKDERLSATTPRHRLPFGANFAFKAEVLKAYTFREDLGRQPGALTLGGEETAILTEIVQDGYEGWLIAGNHVRHWIEADRQTDEYVFKYYYGQGWQQEEARLHTGIRSHLSFHMFFLVNTGLSVLHSVAGKTGWLLARLWLVRQRGHFRGRLDYLTRCLS